ncbi:MAG: glycosyltransferase family 4 protein [FCB group bacterium]|nr:glycosyltransferase family 4 protein [FCB group bacterium]
MPGCTRCNSRMAMDRQKLKILFLNSIGAGIWGGLENWMEMCGVGLARRSHQVCFAGRTDSEFLRRVSSHPDVEILPLDISGDFCPKTIRQLSDYLRKNQIDVVLCNFVKDVRLAGMAQKFGGGCRIVWTPGVNLAKKSFSHRILFSGYVAKVIVPSASLRDEIVASGFIEPSKFEVIPIGIDPLHWQGSRKSGREFIIEKYNLPEDAFICLTSGRFVRQKGHRYLVEAASTLAEKYNNIYFLWLGDGPMQVTLQEQIKDHDLNKHFIFCGLLESHQQVVFGADLYVHPAIVEPFGIVLVEAMAASLPVVASCIGGIPEVVADTETAILVEPRQPSQLTKAIEQFYNNRVMGDKFGQAGYDRFKQNFRLETMIDRVEKSLIEAAQA